MPLYLKIIIGAAAVALVAGGAYRYASKTGEIAATPASGIRGTILLGPTCPVERIPPDPNCADKPYETLVAVFRASDPAHAVVITRSGMGGTFFAAVPPGDYTIGAGESNLPRCGHPAVTVAPGAIATVTVPCDTGIR